METTEVAPSSLPWDTSSGNRFAYYSSDDHSAPLWIAALLGLIYMLGILLVRTFIKRRVLGWDDYLICASTVIAFGQSIVIYSALKTGLGKTVEYVPDTRHLGRLVSSSRVLYLVSLYLAKLSVFFLFCRLFFRDQKGFTSLGNVIIGFTTISGIVSCVISTVGCPSSEYFAEHCSNQATRWRVITAFDVMTEIITLIIPPYMVWHLQMQVESKLRVIVAFSFRLIAIVLSFLHLNAWEKYTAGPPSSFGIVPTLILQQILLAASLITATIPNLKAFLQSLSANWGEADFGYTNNGTKGYGNRTFELKSVKPNKPAASKAEGGALRSIQGDTSFETQIYTPRRELGERNSVGSSGSRDLIIRKETVWIVERRRVE